MFWSGWREWQAAQAPNTRWPRFGLPSDRAAATSNEIVIRAAIASAYTRFMTESPARIEDKCAHALLSRVPPVLRNVRLVGGASAAFGQRRATCHAQAAIGGRRAERCAAPGAAIIAPVSVIHFCRQAADLKLSCLS